MFLCTATECASCRRLPAREFSGDPTWNGHTLWGIFEALVRNVTPRPPGSLAPTLTSWPVLPLLGAWAPPMLLGPPLSPASKPEIDRFPRAPFTAPLPDPFHCVSMIWLEGH